MQQQKPPQRMKPLDCGLCVTAALWGIGAFLFALRGGRSPQRLPWLGLALRHPLPDCGPHRGLVRHLARTLTLGRPQLRSRAAISPPRPSRTAVCLGAQCGT
jgi:hypothetical protein